MPISLRGVVSKLNDTTRAALEGAAGLCLSRTHYDVEIEHYLLKLLDAADSDFARIAKQFEVDTGRLAAELAQSLDKLKTGNSRTPAFSRWLYRMLAEAWSLGSLEYGSTQLRSGFTILALVCDEELARIRSGLGKEFARIEAEALRKQMVGILAASPEQASEQPLVPAGEAKPPGKTPHLDQFTINLTGNARAGRIDPVLGRDAEIRQIIDILTRRRQNNPILTGEAGVGKTAVVEGFALRIAAGEVPPVLRDVTLRTVDLALLQAGAGIKGEFENRLKGLIAEVKSSPTPIILFIDEAHTMIGAGGAAGQNDAANLLKPALARGELRTIAATTWSEYKKYFEKDAALARRFQVVKVEEPTEEQCMVMLRGIVPALEKHHGVRILDEGTAAAVRLSHRYLPDRQLPDKAVSVLDVACARLSISQTAVPGPLEDAGRRAMDCAVRIRILEREAALGADHGEALAGLRAAQAAAEELQASLGRRWEEERTLVARLREVRAQLENPPATAAAAGGEAAPVEDSRGALRSELSALSQRLAELQGEAPLTRVAVDAEIVGQVVSAWTGIPVGRMLKNETETVLALESHLGRRVVGQDHALLAISERLRTSKAHLDDPGKPVGVFLLVGPSGVGKTETALALADLLYGGERNLITINMSEFQEAHTVSTLKGSPPGYVGYGEGGVLTEAVRRRPYSVVLLDEVEKAHPDVLEIFFQVFDKGRMEDGEGREVDFKNTVIILTSNAGTSTIMRLASDPAKEPYAEDLVRALKPELNQIFKPAFLGRLVIIPYYPLHDDMMKEIVRLKLGKIQARLLENHKVALSLDEPVIEEVVRRCREVESGARNADHILTNTLLPDISHEILGRIASGEALEPIHISVGEDGAFVYGPPVQTPAAPPA